MTTIAQTKSTKDLPWGHRWAQGWDTCSPCHSYKWDMAWWESTSVEAKWWGFASREDHIGHQQIASARAQKGRCYQLCRQSRPCRRWRWKYCPRCQRRTYRGGTWHTSHNQCQPSSRVYLRKYQLPHRSKSQSWAKSPEGPQSTQGQGLLPRRQFSGSKLDVPRSLHRCNHRGTAPLTHNPSQPFLDSFSLAAGSIRRRHECARRSNTTCCLGRNHSWTRTFLRSDWHI